MTTYQLVFFEQNRKTFENIRSGKKRIETRDGTAPDTESRYNYSKIKAGDRIKFICNEDYFFKSVYKVRHYPDFEDFLLKENLAEIFGKGTTKERAKEIYLGFPNNYPQRLAKYGMVVIELSE
jgi:ASC-1-like (ASCH) protein